MRKRASLLLAVVFLFSTFIAVTHHHADGADHHGCASCAVSHHTKSEGLTLADTDISPDDFVTEYIVVQPGFDIPVRQTGPSAIRPPPA